MRIEQLGFLTAECLVAAALVLLLLRARTVVGMGALLVTVGSWQFLQALLANTFYVPLTDSLAVSPGSSVLFAANLFAVLVVYVRLGTRWARELMFGIIAANLTITIWSLVLGWHLARPETINFIGVPDAIFALNARFALVGTLVTAMDIFLVTVVWEVLGRIHAKAVVLRSVFTLVLVLALDTLLFSTGAFAGTDQWLPVLVSGLVGKTWCGVVFGVILGLWLHAEGPHYARVAQSGTVQRLLEQDVERTDVGAMLRDPETGLYTREFFWDVLPAELDKAVRTERDAVFVLFDADHFRAYSRTHGPETRQRALQAIGATLLAELGTQDLAVRYANDQFGLLVYEGGLAKGHATAASARRHLRAALAAAHPPLPAELTLTVGLAVVGPDRADARSLTFGAEAKVYEGKVAGRDRVVG